MTRVGPCAAVRGATITGGPLRNRLVTGCGRGAEAWEPPPETIAGEIGCDRPPGDGGAERCTGADADAEIACGLSG